MMIVSSKSHSHLFTLKSNLKGANVVKRKSKQISRKKGSNEALNY